MRRPGDHGPCHLTGGSCAPRAANSASSSRTCRRRARCTSAASRCARRSTGCARSSPARSPGAPRPGLLVDSTPVEAGRSVDTTRRSALADAAGYGYSRSHSRWFWGFRLHLACSPDGTPRAAMLVGADRKEREIARDYLLPQLAGRRHDDRLRQGLRRPRARRTRRHTRHHDHPTRAARRAAHPPSAATADNPPTHREHLLDAQRPAQPGTTRRPHPSQPARPHRLPTALPRRLHQPQPPTRPTQPHPRRLHRIARNQSSSRSRPSSSRSTDRGPRSRPRGPCRTA